jgi:hypothetical protein
MERVLNNQAMYENLFESTVPPLPLPMVWKVIYSEAIRGNHILFDKEDLSKIEAFYHSSEFKLKAENNAPMAKFAVKFFSSSDFQEMRKLIKALPIDQKVVALILYRRSISVWQDWLKRNLH